MTAPLVGIRVLVTRSRSQGSDLVRQLEALGAEAIAIPTIEILPPDDEASLRLAMLDLTKYDWLILTSANAAEVLAAHASAATSYPRIAAIGPGTAKAIERHGFRVELVPPQAIAESLANALLPFAAGSRMLLLRAATARNILPKTLTSAGAHVMVVEAYRTVIPMGSTAALCQLFSSPLQYPHAVTFTSASTATNLVDLLCAVDLVLPETVVRASIGPITSQALRELHLPATIEAQKASIPSLVEALTAHFNRFM